MKRHSFLVTALMCACIPAYASVVLTIDPNTLDNLVKENKAIVRGQVNTVEQDGVKSLDMGTQGYIEIPDFSFPGDRFSIEAFFLLREYSKSDPYISSVAASFYWGYDFSQGVDLRVGGGNHYPLLPTDAYSNAADFIRPDGITRLERAYLSRSIGNFVLGASDGAGGWKEIYATEGVGRSEWTHMVGVWDGSAMRLYINGALATDTWRINGAQNTAKIDPKLNLIIGACCSDGARHFDGLIGFVRVHNTALTTEGVREKYNDLWPDCRCKIHINSPLAGQGITDSTRFHLKVDTTIACEAVLGLVDSIEVMIFEGIDFDREIAKVTTNKMSFSLKELIPPGTQLPHGVIHVRVSCKMRGLAKQASNPAVAPQPSLLPLYSRVTASLTPFNYSPQVKELRRIGKTYDLFGRPLRPQAATGPRTKGIRIIEEASTKKIIRTVK